MSKTLIALGVTGGIAAYKSAQLCSDLVKSGFEVQVIMTENAVRFVTPLTFRTLSRNPVITSLWDLPQWQPEHVALAQSAELFITAPATVNFIAKYANGIADDVLSTLAICMDADKIMLAPAMNPAMWNNIFVQKNVALLKENKIHFCGPADGHVACGAGGSGRMEEPQTIFDAVEKYFGK
jgi:phosphopantothenoylcysteine decarboxylase/phosphopantothenate--cysteine ligase